MQDASVGDLNALTPSRKAEIAAHIYEAVRACFAHWDAVPHLNFDAAFRTYLQEAFQSTDRLKFDFATYRFIAKLENGHTTFNDDWLWREYGASLGFHARSRDDGWYISHSSIPELVAGMRVTHIDGRLVERFAETAMEFIPGSSLRSRKSALFSRAYLFPQAFELVTEDGAKHQIVRGSKQLIVSQEPSGEWIEPGHRFKLRIPSFSHRDYELRAIEIVKQLEADVHLIIDIRGNGGGNTPVDLVASLMPFPYRYWFFTTPCIKALDRARGLLPTVHTHEPHWIEQLPDSFTGALTILVDADTYSAAEDFVLPFKDNGRARILGEPTGGSSGQPLLLDLGDGMKLWVGAKRQYLPDGSHYEGVGIQPDGPITDEMLVKY